MAKWDAALYTDKVLKQSAREQMWTPVKLNSGATHPYGFGWELQTISGHKLVNHGGSLPGFRASFLRFVDDKLTVVVLTNSDNANPVTIARGVADLFIPGLIPQRIAAKVDPKIFDAYAGQYQPNPSTVLTVIREGEKLMIQLGSDEKRELVPESESNFFMPSNREVTYRFLKDETGKVTHIVVQREGQEVGRAKKIK
jgi:hypothetical protein